MRKTLAVVTVLTCCLVSTPQAGEQSTFLWERQLDTGSHREWLAAAVPLGRGVATLGSALLRYTATGQALWRVDPLFNSNWLHMATWGAMVFVASNTSISSINTDIVVRAYHGQTGQVLWEDVFGQGYDDQPNRIAASPTVVVVVGNGGNTSSREWDGLIRAYAPRTGQILWEDTVDAGDTTSDRALSVAITGAQVFVSGISQAQADGALSQTLFLWAYHATTGALLWAKQRPQTSGMLIAQAGRVYVAGAQYLPGAQRASTFLAAFDATTGALLWEMPPTLGNFNDVQICARRLVLLGTGPDYRLLLRVVRVSTGATLWQESPPELWFAAVAVSHSAVYVTGHWLKRAPFPIQVQDADFLVRAYALSDGTLLLDDRSHRSESPWAWSRGYDIAVGPTRVYAVGRVTFGPLHAPASDLLIRAYDRQVIEAKAKRK